MKQSHIKDVDSVIDYYNELISDKIEEGKDIEEILKCVIDLLFNINTTEKEILKMVKRIH